MGKKLEDEFLSLTPHDFAEPERKKAFTPKQFRQVKKILKDFGITVSAAPENVKTYGQLQTWKMELIRTKV